jgi:hypothetical protein
MKKHIRDLVALARDLGVEDAKVRKGQAPHPGRHNAGWQARCVSP